MKSEIEITHLNYERLQVGDLIRVEYSWPESFMFGIVVDVQSPMKMIQIDVIYAEGGYRPNKWTVHFDGPPSGRIVYKLVITDECQ